MSTATRDVHQARGPRPGAGLGQKQPRRGRPAPRGQRREEPESPPEAQATVRRAYTLKLHAPPDLQARLWRTHRALNAGAAVFADWLLTLGGGIPHDRAGAEERRLVALAWLTVEGGAAPTVQTVEDGRVAERLEEILRRRRAPRREIAEWVAAAGAALGAARREDAAWVDRDAAFTALCTELGMRNRVLARADAATIWGHLFGEGVFGHGAKAEKAEEGEGGGARSADSRGAGNLTSHLFSHLFGDAPEGFGKERRKLHYRERWARYLAARLKEEAGLDPLAEESRGHKSGDERAPTPWLRQMFALAAERVAGYRTKMRRQEVERDAAGEGARPLDEMARGAETRRAAELLDEYRRARGEETGAKGPYVIRRRALVGWPEVVARWAACEGADARREALAALQAEAPGGKWGDATLFAALAEDEYLDVWREPGTLRPRPQLLADYAAAWEARLDARRLKVATFRHIDAYEHPVFGRFGVSNPKIRFAPGDGTAPPSVSLVLLDGASARVTPFRAASVRLQTELIEREGEARRSRRTRLAALAARAAAEESGGGEAGDEATLSLLRGVFEEEAAGKILVDRLALASAHEREAHLGWTLSLTLDLRPQGPWLPFARRHKDVLEPDLAEGVPSPVVTNRRGALKASRFRGLSFPFKRKDMDVGFGGELHDLPGLRVLGVDLRQRYGAACSLWESVTAREFEAACAPGGRVRGRRRPQVADTWAVIPGAGLFRRTGPDTARAPWARLVRQVTITLPGEERDPRPLIDKELSEFTELATRLGTAPPERADGFQAAARRLLRAFDLAQREHAREAVRLARGAGVQAEEAGAEGGAERRPEERLAEWRRRDAALGQTLGRIERLLTGAGRVTRSRDRGGLSLRRIETLEELYRRQKQFHARPTPGEPRGRTVPESFALGLRRKIAELKQIRIRTLVARVVGCALGEDADGQPAYPYAHALVIEDLRGYRADSTQTRRENRGLMAWAAGSVRDELAISAQLHGLHMRELPAAYTSRRSVKTAAPAIRCFEMSAGDLREHPYWKREAQRAVERDGRGTARPAEQLLAWYAGRLATGGLPEDRPVLVPADEGVLLVSLDEKGRLRKTHVGQDAAANIGLDALMGPTFPAGVWKVPAKWNARGHVYEPAGEGRRPRPALAGWSAPAADGDPLVTGRVVNLWRDPSSQRLTEGDWLTTPTYWRTHEEAICRAIEAAAKPQTPGAST